MSTTPRNTASSESVSEVTLQSFDTLPSQMHSDDREALEQAGVVFGDPVPDDDLLTYVTLPEGWTKADTRRSTHFRLLDNKGRTRAKIFYLAKLGERRANLRVSRRFNISMDEERDDQESVIIKFITDGDVKIFTTKVYRYVGEQYGESYWKQSSAASDEAMAWLAANFPNWEDTSAYWD